MKVKRIIDLITREVSLVDRPANKKRFFLFKRDEDEKIKEKKIPVKIKRDGGK